MVTGEYGYISDPNARLSDGLLNSNWAYKARLHTIYLASGAAIRLVGDRQEVPGATYKDSDLLSHLDGWSEAIGAEADPSDRSYTAARIEHAFRKTFNAPDLTLQHILSGVNPRTEYPYQRFGFYAHGYAPEMPEETVATPRDTGLFATISRVLRRGA